MERVLSVQLSGSLRKSAIGLKTYADPAILTEVQNVALESLLPIYALALQKVGQHLRKQDPGRHVGAHPEDSAQPEG